MENIVNSLKGVNAAILIQNMIVKMEKNVIILKNANLDINIQNAKMDQASILIKISML